MKGTQLCCKFSGITNKLNYCGPSNAFKGFLAHVKTGENEAQIKDMLSKFEGLYPYLQLIAKKHNLDAFDFRVIEAYWIGNELLDSFTKEDFVAFLPELEKRGLPSSVVQRLKQNVPDNALPHHTFNVLFVGVGQITSSVPTNLENMQNCMATWGEVIEINDKLRIKGPVLQMNNGKYFLSEEEREVLFSPEVFQPKVGDIVAVHWNTLSHILTNKQLENVKKYTEKIIETVNSIPSSS